MARISYLGDCHLVRHRGFQGIRSPKSDPVRDIHSGSIRVCARDRRAGASRPAGRRKSAAEGGRPMSLCVPYCFEHPRTHDVFVVGRASYVPAAFLGSLFVLIQAGPKAFFRALPVNPFLDRHRPVDIRSGLDWWIGKDLPAVRGAYAARRLARALDDPDRAKLLPEAWVARPRDLAARTTSGGAESATRRHLPSIRTGRSGRGNPQIAFAAATTHFGSAIGCHLRSARVVPAVR